MTDDGKTKLPFDLSESFQLSAYPKRTSSDQSKKATSRPTGVSAIMGTTKVTIKLKEPIRGTLFPSTLILMAVGILLLLYPLAWLFFLHYYESANEERNNKSIMWRGIHWVLRDVSYWILDLIPWMANAGLSLFLAAFFLYAGSIQRHHEKAE